MATRYKARSGGKNPDLDLLDTMYTENELTHTNRGAKAATEASRGALDFYRLKAAPPAEPTALRAAVAHALGATLAAKVLKQAGDNVVDQAIERLRVAATERAKTDGDQAIAGYIDKMAQTIGPSSGSAAGSLGDDEKATKEARNDDTFLGRPGMAESLAAQARAAQELHAALDPYRNGHKWW